MNGQRHPPVPLILGADILAYSNDAELVAATLQSALAPNGGKAYIVSPDETRRFGVTDFPQACSDLGLQVEQSILMANNEHDDDDRNNAASCADMGDRDDAAAMAYDFYLFAVTKP